MPIVRWWSIIIPTPVHLGRRRRPRGRLTSIRVHVWVRNASWTSLAIWNIVTSIPRSPESVGTFESLSRPLRVGILIGIVLGEGAVWVNDILVTSGRVLVRVWICLLYRGRAGGRGSWLVGAVWIKGGTLLMGHSRMIYARTFRTAK